MKRKTWGLITNAVKECGWSYFCDSEGRAELETHSPAGEDFSFNVSRADIVKDIREYAETFSEKAYVVEMAKAKNIKDVQDRKAFVDDAAAIAGKLKELAKAVEAAEHAATYISGIAAKTMMLEYASDSEDYSAMYKAMSESALIPKYKVGTGHAARMWYDPIALKAFCEDWGKHGGLSSDWLPSRKLNGLYLLVGPSGGGKSSVEAELVKRLGCIPLRSYTDRAPRYDGEDNHTFLTKEQFDGLKDIVAYTKFAGHQYGATRALVEHSDTYVIDPRGVTELFRRYETARPIHIIGITAPDWMRRERMLKRGDNEKSIADRLNSEKTDFSLMETMCEIIVPNIELKKTVDTIETYILACEKHRK